MSEKLPQQSEDPLPTYGEYDESPYKYSKEPPSSLGELVVTDPRDPFVWLSRIPFAGASEKAKKVMWAIYRLECRPPDEDSTGKLRDQEPTDHIFDDLDEYDEQYIAAYQQHLLRIEMDR